MPGPGAYIPYEFITHTRRVQTLYKAILRDIRSWETSNHLVRIQSVLMRQKFEENRHVKDPIKARTLLEEAEKKFDYIQNPDPILFPDSVGGTADGRKDAAYTQDSVLDYWHPLRKAQYPDYFARREQRKKEFVEWYDKTYGKPAFEQVE